MPVLDQFEDFNAFQVSSMEWTIREVARRADAKLHQATRATAVQAQAQQLAKLGHGAREKFTDYDAVIEPVIAQLGQIGDEFRLANDVADYVAQSAVGGELFYALGKDPAALQAVLTAASPVALARELARLELQLTPSATVVPPVTRAPAPPQHTVGGGASAPALDTRKGVPLKDHIRIEEAELAERRRQGYRT